MASLSDSNTWLPSLIESGADAMTNLYYADFSSSNMLEEENSGKYTVRLSSISGLPTFSHKTETKKFMTVDFDAPVNDFDFEKRFIRDWDLRIPIFYSLYL